MLEKSNERKEIEKTDLFFAKVSINFQISKTKKSSQNSSNFP